MKPQMDTDEHGSNEIAEKIIGCVYRVANGLGCGFLEKVYENALFYELTKAGLEVKQQHPILIRYEGVVVGEYVADLLVEGRVLVELKAVQALDDVHTAQCINYLRGTGLVVCLLINFGRPKVQIKRLMGPAAMQGHESGTTDEHGWTQVRVVQCPNSGFTIRVYLCSSVVSMRFLHHG